MSAVVLVLHLFLAAALIGVVLIQRSEGGALGGLGGGNMGGIMTGRGTANLLTRVTAILAASFIATSLILALLAGGTRQPSSVLDLPASAPVGPVSPSVPTSDAPAPVTVPVPTAPLNEPSTVPPPPTPAAPTPPSAPLAQ